MKPIPAPPGLDRRLYNAIKAHEDHHHHPPTASEVAAAVGEDEPLVTERLNALALDPLKPIQRIKEAGSAPRFMAIETSTGRGNGPPVRHPTFTHHRQGVHMNAKRIIPALAAVAALAAPSAASASATSCRVTPAWSQWYTALSVQSPRTTVAEHVPHTGWVTMNRCYLARGVAAQISGQSEPGSGNTPSNRLNSFDEGSWSVSTKYGSPTGLDPTGIPYGGQSLYGTGINAVFVTARQGRLTVTFEDVAAEL